MGRALIGTVIITGGNGVLSAEIATAIARTRPFVHLLLAVRDVRGEVVQSLKDRIRVIGPRSMEFISLDPTDVQSVTGFCQHTVDRIRHKEIPPIITLIYTDALVSYTVDELTQDGYDPVYQTNCVTPFFLTVGLLEGFRCGGEHTEGAKVITIGSSAALSGRMHYFDHHQGRDERPPGTSLSTREGQARFASSKLIGSVALYALRRSLANGKHLPRHLNPGSWKYWRKPSESDVCPSWTAADLPPGLPRSKKAAKVIAQVAFQAVGMRPRERYMIRDKNYEAGSVLKPLQDGAQTGALLAQMLQRLEVTFRRRRQLFQRLVLVCGVSLLLIIFLFPSWRAALLPTLSLGLFHPSVDLQLQTVRYYDLSDVQGTAKGWERGERVLMLTPLRDASSHLPMFFSHLRNLTYPHNLIDLAFLVSDSRDDTLSMLSRMLMEVQNDPDPKMSFGEVSVIQKDFGQKVQQDVESRHGFQAQASRRKLMAQARNWLLSATLRPTHSWVYWRDADVQTAPTTIIEDLMAHDKDVTVPNVWRPLPDWLGGEQPYDLNSWQESDSALELADTLDEDAVIVEGYAEYATWRPHLAYLRDPYGDPDMEMELDGIGGVSILAKAKVFRSGVHFPAFSFEKHAETEGFGKMELEKQAHEREEKEQKLAAQKEKNQSPPQKVVDSESSKGSDEGPFAQPVKNPAKGFSNED
ncbi:hypothetical protein N7470_008545 [Penicillium chermesinum]|nr:hypothetical protein N7470_008545 [Penicillium chermesinum]